MVFIKPHYQVSLHEYNFLLGLDCFIFIICQKKCIFQNHILHSLQCTCYLQKTTKQNKTKQKSMMGNVHGIVPFRFQNYMDKLNFNSYPYKLKCYINFQLRLTLSLDSKHAVHKCYKVCVAYAANSSHLTIQDNATCSHVVEQ